MNDQLFNQVFGFIRDNAGAGSQATGQVSDYLVQLGLGTAAISQILNQVATSAAASPAQLAYVQQEMAYLQQQQFANQNSNTGWIKWLVIGGLGYLVYEGMKD